MNTEPTKVNTILLLKVMRRLGLEHTETWDRLQDVNEGKSFIGTINSIIWCIITIILGPVLYHLHWVATALGMWTIAILLLGLALILLGKESLFFLKFLRIQREIACHEKCVSVAFGFCLADEYPNGALFRASTRENAVDVYRDALEATRQKMRSVITRGESESTKGLFETAKALFGEEFDRGRGYKL